MFARHAVAGLAVACGLWAAPSRAETLLAPSSAWIMDYNVDRCVLSRSFGTASDEVTIRFIRHQPSDSFELTLIGRPFSTRTVDLDIGLRFGDSGPFVSQSPMAGRVGDRSALFAGGRLDNLQPGTDAAAAHLSAMAAERMVKRLHITVRERLLVVELGPMAKPMQALRNCEGELVRSWGLDPQEQAALASRPQPLTPPHTWITSADYPEKSGEEGMQAIISFRLMVDATGASTGCSIQTNIAESKDFADQTCRALMKRARFAPAKSTSGEPKASYYTNKVRWLIPG